MSCHICVKTGEKTCDPQAAEIKCMICGRCEAERLTRVAGDEWPSTCRLLQSQGDDQ